MPSTAFQWIFFAFYTLGAFGGWVLLALMLRDQLRGRR